VSLLKTEFPGDVKLDKIGIIADSEASSGIGIMSETEVRLDKNAISHTIVTEDIIPKANRRITVVETRRDVLKEVFDAEMALRSKMENRTSSSYQSIAGNRGIKIIQCSPHGSS